MGKEEFRSYRSSRVTEFRAELGSTDKKEFRSRRSSGVTEFRAELGSTPVKSRS
jgi:hypothetical protein